MLMDPIVCRSECISDSLASDVGSLDGDFACTMVGVENFPEKVLGDRVENIDGCDYVLIYTVKTADEIPINVFRNALRDVVRVSILLV